jgi:hypothetical protein
VLQAAPWLGPPTPEGHAQKEQMTMTDAIIGSLKEAFKWAGTLA